tara:strand:- start:3251 stop:3475 length:225 start_codon:yes stop_codon:yes gene_type:complete
MNIDKLILEVIISKENGRYHGEFKLSDPTKKLSEEDLENILSNIADGINTFSEHFTKSINLDFFEKLYDELKNG